MEELDKFNNECIYAHNELRKAHDVPPLVYDRNLAIEAENYAKVIATQRSLRHSSSGERKNAGESLASSKKEFENYVFSGLAVSVTWYSEIRDYDFVLEKQTSNKSTGHFTQVIWKETEKAGFGRVKDAGSNTWYVVGRYYPAGNIRGYYKRNVPLLQKKFVKWENIPVVKEYLEELKTWEFTKGRKHILDSYSWSVTSLKNKNGFLIKEYFTPKDGESYYESQMFDKDITKEPRPVYVVQNIKQHPSTETEPIKKKEIKMRDTPDCRFRNENDENEDDNGDDNVFSDFSLPKRSDQEHLSFIDCILQRHNYYRKSYRVGALTLDQELSKIAQTWASTLATENYLGFSNFQYKGSEIGENIAAKNDPLNTKSGKQLIDNWYNENKRYIYGKKVEDIKDFGHFTQMVWKETRTIGIGVATNSSGFNFIVCFYYPPGNIKNEFEKMVPSLLA